MDKPVAINKVTASMNITGRTLRHWEAEGLFKSTRDKESGWRLYDEDALQAIRLTNLLRRLDISIGDIKEIMESKTIETVCLVLKKQMDKLGEMSSELNLRREAISELVNILQTSSVMLSSLENILLPATLVRNKYDITKIKEGLSMGTLEQNNKIDFIKLPPMRTVAYSCIGTEPEDEAYAPVAKWVEDNKLQGTMRMFGFNTEPYPTNDNPAYGFGFCASIPEGIDIPAPLCEKRLPGGVYGIVGDYTGDPSHGWKKVKEFFADKTCSWEYDSVRPGLEEHIIKGDGNGFIITILFPVKKKQ